MTLLCHFQVDQPSWPRGQYGNISIFSCFCVFDSEQNERVKEDTMRFNVGCAGKILGALLILGASASQAATVAVIDSGVDFKHEAFASDMWSNPNGSTTVDGTTYSNDTHGWNFAENNNQIIDYKYLGTFSADCYKMFDIQGKILRGIATDAEKEWYKNKRSDETFLKELQKFGNFIHGTHVAGISTDQSDAAKIVGVKLIPTETPGAKAMAQFRDKAGNPLVSLMLQMVAKRQAGMLLNVGKYTNAVRAEVANGSFGTSVSAVKPVVSQLVKQLTGADPSDAEAEEYAKELVNALITESKSFVAAAPNTLFVFAAGNDGTNNDQLPVSPANIDAENKIVVAATLGSEKIATFSNFGLKVDVAAPGVVIRASIPGNQYLELSGTSMAAPYVTNVAARLKDLNPGLGVAAIKKILCETVDVKPWLQGKVRTSGIVNSHRALKAAELAGSMGVEQAILESKTLVADLVEFDGSGFVPGADKDMLVAPLPSLF
jgi:cell wall-associated protease